MQLAQIADLAWAGKHEEAIGAATATLGRKRIDVEERVSLLDLRAESLMAIGDLKGALADAEEMTALAKAERRAHLLARALSRRSAVKTRQRRSWGAWDCSRPAR